MTYVRLDLSGLRSIWEKSDPCGKEVSDYTAQAFAAVEDFFCNYSSIAKQIETGAKILESVEGFADKIRVLRTLAVLEAVLIGLQTQPKKGPDQIL